MDLQQITLAAVLAVLVLQLITLSLIASKKKQGRGPGEVRRPGGGGEFRGEKKDGDPRRGGSGGRKPGDNRGGSGGNRPQQQNRPQPQNQQAAASIDPMEKSLRDINLRLKNAEREQENARKKFQESGGGGGGAGRDNRDSRPPHQRNDRSGGGNRGGGGNRDFNRDRPPRVDNRPEKPYRGEQESPAFSAPETEQPVTAPATPDIVVNDIGVSEDQLQHGRKFTAKRRPLPSDAAPETDVIETGVPENDTPQFTESAPDVVQDVQTETEQQSEGTDIQFGRR